MTAPVISVLLPVYNAERYLAEAVRSVLRQTFTDFELIVVDDGSTDRSLQILRSFADGDPRLRIISRPNTGIVGALNDAMAAARGRLLARMDADDISLPERFERQVRYLEQHPQCVLIGTQVHLIDPEGLRIGIMSVTECHEEIEARLLEGLGSAVVHPAMMARRESIEGVGGYRVQYQWAEDLDLYLRVGERGRLGNVPEVLLEYRQHPKSVNRIHREQQEKVVDRLLREAFARRGIEPPAQWRYRHSPVVNPPEQLLRWGWGALKLQEYGTARRYARRRLLARPLSLDSWRLLYCAVRGY